MEQSFLHYEIIEKLGEGGMGVVYLARDTRLQRKVALKFLPDRIAGHSTERKRFRREARAAAGLSHPNIAQVHAIENSGEAMCIVMEYVDGEELHELITQNRLDEDQKTDVARQIGEGLAAAHREGIIHRDIKSRNIMVDEDGRVKIMDFGLARSPKAPHITRTGATVGTTAYMSPEQLAGEEADERSDIWSLGVVLYELFTGELPFRGAYEQAVMYAITNEEPDPVTDINPEAPEGMASVIGRCLEKEPSRRYQHIQELLDEMEGTSPAVQDTGSRGWFARMAGGPATYMPYIALPVLLVAALVLFALPLNISLLEGRGADRQVIAVLPVENINNNPDLQPLCEGLPETFTERLSKLKAIEESYWIAPASEMRTREITSASQAYQKLGVDLVVMSSIYTVEDSTKLSISLVETETVRQLGSEQVVQPTENLAGLERQGIRSMLNMMRREFNLDIPDVEEDDSTQPQAYAYLRGTISRGEGELDEAIAHFQEALDMDPDYGPAYRGLADVYEQQGRTEMAVKTYKKAISRNPGAWEGYRDLGKYYMSREEFGKAITQFQKVVDRIPNNSMAYSNLGAAYAYNRQLDKAHDVLVKALELGNNGIAASNLGVIYYGRGAYEEAARMFEIAVKAHPNDYRIWGNLASSYDFINRRQEALENYRTAARKAESQLESDSSNAVLLGHLGTYYSELGDSARVVKYISRATDLNPDMVRVRRAAVAAYEQLGMREEALRWIDASMTGWVESQPDFQELIQDPRYLKLKKKWSAD